MKLCQCCRKNKSFFSVSSSYGLLGPSGCGKTSLLSCIVGVKFLNSGSIKVLGGEPGSKESGVPGPRVGYMPQDISLLEIFTIKEIIYYFGRICGVHSEDIEKNFNILKDLLELPDENRFVMNCSGGQKRCISFAACMIHKPELLILDEPTVGLDPLLREKLWEFLVKTAKSINTAIIITTHYIEEARQADCVINYISKLHS